jgi:hypothetical protein
MLRRVARIATVEGNKAEWGMAPQLLRCVRMALTAQNMVQKRKEAPTFAASFFSLHCRSVCFSVRLSIRSLSQKIGTVRFEIYGIPDGQTLPRNFHPPHWSCRSHCFVKGKGSRQTEGQFMHIAWPRAKRYSCRPMEECFQMAVSRFYKLTDVTLQWVTDTFRYKSAVSNRHLWAECLQNAGAPKFHSPMGLPGFNGGITLPFSLSAVSNRHNGGLSFHEGPIYKLVPS